MTRSVASLLLAAMLLAACGGAADTAPTADGGTPGPTTAAAATAAPTEIDDEEAEAAAALAGFCEDLTDWVAALQQYQQVEEGSEEEAAAVEEMQRLTPLINDRVDIPELSTALETITADATAFVSGGEPAADPQVLEDGAELINNLLTNCQ